MEADAGAHHIAALLLLWERAQPCSLLAQREPAPREKFQNILGWKKVPLLEP